MAANKGLNAQVSGGLENYLLVCHVEQHNIKQQRSANGNNNIKCNEKIQNIFFLHFDFNLTPAQNAIIHQGLKVGQLFAASLFHLISTGCRLSSSSNAAEVKKKKGGKKTTSSHVFVVHVS